MGYPLDEIDVRLLASLQRDCKTPLQKLGEQVGLSAPSVMERVRKLERAGVIQGYHARIDPPRVGLGLTAFIGVTLNYPRLIEQIEAWVEGEPRVLECHHVTGDHTLMLKAITRDTRELEDLISGMRAIDGIERTQTMVVLSTQGERQTLPLAVDAAPPPRKARARRRTSSA